VLKEELSQRLLSLAARAEEIKELEEERDLFLRKLGTQFTCFSGTKVHLLTQYEDTYIVAIQAVAEKHRAPYSSKQVSCTPNFCMHVLV
jgi:hypothetical protein